MGGPRAPNIRRGATSTTRIAALSPHPGGSPAQDGSSSEPLACSSAGGNGPLTPPTSPAKNAAAPPLDLVQVMSKLELGGTYKK